MKSIELCSIVIKNVIIFFYLIFRYCSTLSFKFFDIFRIVFPLVIISVVIQYFREIGAPYIKNVDSLFQIRSQRYFGVVVVKAL